MIYVFDIFSGKYFVLTKVKVTRARNKRSYISRRRWGKIEGDGQQVSDRLCLMIKERVTISCMVSDLEKDKVLRTNRAFDCLSRLHQRSI